tara:strand:- start:814 stop:978 length:165 start_codon:yes stop_codon:yes gene_type:complete
MKTFKRLNSKTIRLTRYQQDGSKLQAEYTGVMIGDVPIEYNHWFNYKGLTYVIS